MSTKIYLFNENGFLPSNGLSEFQSRLLNSCEQFTPRIAASEYPFHTLIQFANCEFILYEHGYIITLEGEISEVMKIILVIDTILVRDIEYYLGYSQRIENANGIQYPRGCSIESLAEHLDKLFNNKDYTSSIVI